MRKFLPWVIVPLGFALLIWVPFFQALDWRGLDPFLPAARVHPDIVVLAVDNRSITELGRWPWDRDRYAELLKVLEGVHPRALGIDIMFSEESDPAKDAAFARALGAASFPVVLPVELGHVHVPRAVDGLARSLPGVQMVGGTAYPSFVAALAQSLGADRSDYGAGAMMAYAGPAGTIPTYSVTDVLNGRLPSDVLQESIILVGATASDLHDTVAVPVGSGLMSGVEWHATVLSNMLLRSAHRALPAWIEFVLGLLMGLGSVASAARSRATVRRAYLRRFCNPRMRIFSVRSAQSSRSSSAIFATSRRSVKRMIRIFFRNCCRSISPR